MSTDITVLAMLKPHPDRVRLWLRGRNQGFDVSVHEVSNHAIVCTFDNKPHKSIVPLSAVDIIDLIEEKEDERRQD